MARQSPLCDANDIHSVRIFHQFLGSIFHLHFHGIWSSSGRNFTIAKERLVQPTAIFTNLILSRYLQLHYILIICYSYCMLHIILFIRTMQAQFCFYKDIFMIYFPLLTHKTQNNQVGRAATQAPPDIHLEMITCTSFRILSRNFLLLFLR